MAASSRRPGWTRRWAYPALAVVTGSAVTVYEFAAPSLFRGYFGQTIYVWANVIGVILGALALGYGLGGRWADRTTTIRPLAAVVLFAGAWGLVVAWVGPAVCGWLTGAAAYTPDAALPAFVMESLAASLVLFAPALVALGMATPLMVERASASWPVGGAAGTIFAIGTVGSIAGIYLTTFAFVDWWGVAATIRAAGGTLVVLGVFLFLRGRHRRSALAGAAALVLVPFGGDAPWEELPPAGSRLVLAIESPYQLIRVVDRPPVETDVVFVTAEAEEGVSRSRLAERVAAPLEDACLGVPGTAAVRATITGRTVVLRVEPEEGTAAAEVLEGVRRALPGLAGVTVEARRGRTERWLAFDEGMGTYHSMQVAPGTLWTGAYYDAFARLPEWIGGEGPWRICILGNAAGTMSQLLHAHHGADALELDGVEIDPAVTRAARRTMGLTEGEAPHASLRIFHEDGRTFLARRPEGHYDAIVLDAYARQVSIPAALATREFFALAKSRLRPGGMLFVNLGALRAGGRLVHVLADTIHAGFGTPVCRAPLLHQTNVLLVARRGGTPPPPPRDGQLFIHASFGLHRPGDGLVLTDDHCPVESLTAGDLRLSEVR